MNYNEHNQTYEFLDSLASNSFIPLILQSTGITNHSNSVIDKNFSHVIDPDIISGNLTAIISDHLSQFSIIPNMFGNIPGNKSNIYERDNIPEKLDPGHMVWALGLWTPGLWMTEMLGLWTIDSIVSNVAIIRNFILQYCKVLHYKRIPKESFIVRNRITLQAAFSYCSEAAI